MSRLIFTAKWCFIILFFVGFLPNHVHSSIANWQMGANIMPSTNTDLASESLKQSLSDLKATGATHVGFIIPYYQADKDATIINRGGNTPTDEALTSAVTYAHYIGLAVSLKIHVETHDHEWRAYINPTNRDEWFASYGTILKHYGTIAQTQNIEQIVIGTELINMSSDSINSTNTAHWRNLIASLRSIYDGTLTYGANWGDGTWTEETNQIKFWDDLDYIGISAYYWLSPTEDDSVESMITSWDDWNERKLQPLAEMWDKQIVFTEVGYRSITGAHNHPWNWWDNGIFDEQEQANDYTALFSYWNTKDYFNGVMFWSWEIDPDAGGTNDLGYTPQNKLAETVMTQWFTNPPSPNPTSPSFTIVGSTVSTEHGIPTEVTISVTNESSQAISALVDIVIYSPQYQKIHQKFFTAEHFSGGETKIFTTTWTGETEGSYPVMVGVFSNDWLASYHWNSDAGKVVVGEEGVVDTPPPAPAESIIDIWWPSDGTVVSGTQPFKVLLTERSLDTYVMYWQVEGGDLNEMENSNVDYPHKESIVDLSNWRWKNDNSYVLTFVAKENSEETILSRSIIITVIQ